jgi:multidrug resistance efflux pump
MQLTCSHSLGHRTRARLLLLGTVLVLGFSGCTRPAAKAKEDASSGRQEGPVKVAVVHPHPETLRRTVGQPGFIEAFEEAPIYAKISGYVQKRHVDIGDIVYGPFDLPWVGRVYDGEVLAELWVPEVVEELKQKEGQVKQAQEGLKVAQAQVTTASAQLHEARAGLSRAQANKQRWQIENERVADLVKRGVMDKQTALETWNQFQAASSSFQEAEAKVASMEAALKENEARRDKARIDIGVAEADRNRVAALAAYAQVRAPFTGVVTRRTIDTRHFVQSAGVAKGEPLFVVARTGLMRIFVEVPEADADWVSRGARATVRVQAQPGREISGTVARTSWSLNRTARTLRTEIDVEDPDIRPNNYAFATITAERPKVLALPASSIITQGDITQGYEHFCFRVEQDKALKTPVQIGARAGDLVEVIMKQTRPARPGQEIPWEKFSGKEKIVKGPVAALKDGQPVTVVP